MEKIILCSKNQRTSHMEPRALYTGLTLVVASFTPSSLDAQHRYRQPPPITENDLDRLLTDTSYRCRAPRYEDLSPLEQSWWDFRRQDLGLLKELHLKGIGKVMLHVRTVPAIDRITGKCVGENPQWHTSYTEFFYYDEDGNIQRIAEYTGGLPREISFSRIAGTEKFRLRGIKYTDSDLTYQTSNGDGRNGNGRQIEKRLNKKIKSRELDQLMADPESSPLRWWISPFEAEIILSPKSPEVQISSK